MLATVTDFTDRLLKERADGLRAWWALSTFFGGCEVPIVMRARLMFVPMETYQEWAIGSSIPKRYIPLSEKYVRLHTLALKQFGDTAHVAQWFLRESFSPLYGGRSPAQSIIDGEEKTLSAVIDSFELNI